MRGFNELSARGGRSEPAWLRKLRDEALDALSAKGLPTTHDEDGASPTSRSLNGLPSACAANVEAAVRREIKPCRHTRSACRLVFVNGHFAPRAFRADRLPEGVEVTQPGEGSCGRNMLDVASSSIWAAMPTFERDAFAALNTACGRMVRYVRVSAACASSSPYICSM